MIKRLVVSEYMLDQVEYSILCTNKDTVAFCEAHNMDIYQFIELIIHE